MKVGDTVKPIHRSEVGVIVESFVSYEPKRHFVKFKGRAKPEAFLEKHLEVISERR